MFILATIAPLLLNNQENKYMCMLPFIYLIIILPNLNLCLFYKHISIVYMALNGVLLTEINDRAWETAEQDRTASLWGIILIYTLHKMKLWSETAVEGRSETSHA